MYGKLTDNRAPEGFVTLKDKSVTALPDGGLRILIPDPKNEEEQIPWFRSWYVLPLEVTCPSKHLPEHISQTSPLFCLLMVVTCCAPMMLSLFPTYNLFQAKRKQRISAKDGKEKVIDITDVTSSVFAGQVFAEMLAVVNHPEHYRYSNQEVPLIISRLSYPPGIRNLHYAYIIPIISLCLPT